MPDHTSLFNRVYNADRSYEYHNQLHTWSSRIGISPIKFQANLTEYRTEDGQRLYQAIPIFPRVYERPVRLEEYAGRARSKANAQQESARILQQVRLNSNAIVRWDFVPRQEGYYEAVPCLYGGPTLLQDHTCVIGWATTKRGAIEDSSEKLLRLKYCRY